MIAALLRKILSSLLTLLLLTMIVFLLVHVIMPGDYVSQFMGMPLSEKERLRHELGLDLPFWQQYLRWLAGLFQGHLGRSFNGMAVMDAVLAALPSTLLVFLTGGSLAFMIGHWLGKLIGWRNRGWFSEGTALTVIGLYAFFPPALAFLLKYFLGEQLEWFPANPAIFWHLFERDFADVNPVSVVSQMVSTLVGVTLAAVVIKEFLNWWRRIRPPDLLFILMIPSVWIGSWFALGIDLPAMRLLHYAALPILAFTLLTLGEMAIITRTSLAETLHEEYITTARAKGLSEAVIRDRHAARNALLPVISKAIVSLPYLIGGLAIIEYSLGLGLPALGSAVFQSILSRDAPLALGYLLFIGLFAMAARLLLELIYLYLDPRIRSKAQEERVKP